MVKDASILSRNLSIGYHIKGKKSNIIHDSLNLTVCKGELTSLLGLNGAGKSTLLRTLCGFQPPLSGEIEINGKNIKEYTGHCFSLMVGVVLTEKTNAGGITAYELVSIGRHPHTGFWGKMRENDHQVVAAAIEAVGITHKSKSFFSELSDGEKQKVIIAKALAQESPIIVLDEPTAFLDIKSRIEIMALLHKLAAEHGKTILLSTHDLDLAIKMSDSICLLDRKMPLTYGAPEELVSNGSFEKYFGKEITSFLNI